MQSTYFPPAYQDTSYHCPLCNVFANQGWTQLHVYSKFVIPSEIWMTTCYHCEGHTYWHDEKLIVPDVSPAPLPHVDMPEALKEDYLEARSIVNKSPRGAAALFRLCLQKLTKELGKPGKHINDDIAALVRDGLPEEIQQACDILRVVGNEAVHPGTMDLKDDIETATQLFELINFIVEEAFTRKKRIASLYAKLPNQKREEIARRK